MIHTEDLRKMAHIDASPESPVLSVYLNTDRSQMANLNKGFHVPLKNMLRGLADKITDAERRQMFEQDAQPVRDFVQDHHPAEGTKCILAFSSAPAGLFDTYSFSVPLENEARWQPWPHLRPLAEALDWYQPCAIILVDREKARLCLLHMGEVVEERVRESSEDVHHFDASGKDKMWSQMIFQHKADEHVSHHLETVAEETRRLHGELAFSRVMLSGSGRITEELCEHLKPSLRRRVAGTMTLEPDAPKEAIWREWQAIQSNALLEEQAQLVEQLITVSAKQGDAVTGFVSTLDACLKGRVRQLLYLNGNGGNEREREECLRDLAAAYRVADQGTPVESADRLTDWFVTEVIRQGGGTTRVMGDPGERLKESARGIGAFLR